MRALHWLLTGVATLAASPAQAASATETRELGSAPGGYHLRARFAPVLCEPQGTSSPADSEPQALPLEARSWTLEVVKAGKVAARFRIDGSTAVCEPEHAPGIEVGDFDFDGKQDFLVAVDRSGPYGTTTQDVFLATAGATPFWHAHDLSGLWHTSLAVEVDSKHKRLRTYSKSGAAIHYASEYSVAKRETVWLWSETTTLSSDEEDRCVVTVERSKPNGRTHTVQRPCGPDD